MVPASALFVAVLLALPTGAVGPHRTSTSAASAPGRIQLTSTETPSGSCGAAGTTCGIALAINIYDNTQLTYVIKDVASFIEPRDVFVLVSGNNGNSLSVTWLDTSAAALKQQFPTNQIYAYTAGVQNVALAAKETNGTISGILYGYEPGMANEPEFTWTFSTSSENMAAASAAATGYGKVAGAAPTGRPLLESDLQQYGWNYGQLSSSLGLTIVQTQTWAKKGGSTLSKALTLLQQQYAGTSENWMPQLTVDSTDGNGISAAAAYQDTLTMESDSLRYVSIWWSDQTTYFGTYLSLLRAQGSSPKGHGHAKHTVTSARIFGSTADATAAQELYSAFPWVDGTCPGTAGDRPVVLATDTTFPDALSSSYLAGWLGTGTLLAPTAALSAPSLEAIAREGITHVYVLGGSLAISTAVVHTLEATDVTSCGGGAAAAGTIHVTRVAGPTRYATAADVAATPGGSFVASLDLSSAYGGPGSYNTTTGSSSSGPAHAGGLPTAIVASGEGFQDAESAATLAYAGHLPLLLTTRASLSPSAATAIGNLGILQVVLMGGPLAVSTTVVTQLEHLGVSVLRVAGSSFGQTAIELADLELASSSAGLGAGWAPTGGVVVARGDFYSDGLAGAVVASGSGASGGGAEPMLLTEGPTTVGTSLTRALTDAGGSGIDSDGTVVTSLTVLGGPMAVATSVVQEMESDLG